MEEWIIALQFLTSALDGGEWSAWRACRLTLGQRIPGTHRIGVWVGPEPSGHCGEEKNLLSLPGFELRAIQIVTRRYTVSAITSQTSSVWFEFPDSQTQNKRFQCNKLQLNTMQYARICKTLLLVLREWRRLNASENMVQRKIFGPTTEGRKKTWESCIPVSLIGSSVIYTLHLLLLRNSLERRWMNLTRNTYSDMKKKTYKYA
jgi:hypothetical protein